jgi:hypothetical protein
MRDVCAVLPLCACFLFIVLCRRTPTLKNLGKRYEWFRLQYDTVFDAHACYHMELMWVAATGLCLSGFGRDIPCISHHLLLVTGTLIEDWVQNFKRKGKQYGFHIVQIPTAQPLRTADSFHTTLSIALPRLASGGVCEAARTAAQQYLLQHCGFVPDSRQSRSCLCFALCFCVCGGLTFSISLSFSFFFFLFGCSFRRQYMHYTGASLVRTVTDGFVWVNNQLISANPVRSACHMAAAPTY